MFDSIYKMGYLCIAIRKDLLISTIVDELQEQFK